MMRFRSKRLVTDDASPSAIVLAASLIRKVKSTFLLAAVSPLGALVMTTSFVEQRRRKSAAAYSDVATASVKATASARVAPMLWAGDTKSRPPTKQVAEPGA